VKKSKKAGMGKMSMVSKQGHGRNMTAGAGSTHMGGATRGLSKGGMHDKPPMGRKEMKSPNK
jgi:hypothetical protein